MRSSPSAQPLPILDSRRPLQTLRILVLLDREVLARVVELTLSQAGYLTRTVETVPEALHALQAWQPHLAVVNMDIGGVPFLEQVRAQTVAPGMSSSLPVIALARRGELHTLLDAFEHGVQDVLTVPLSAGELLARTRAVLQRTYDRLAPIVPVIRRGDLAIDIVDRSVRIGELVLDLNTPEYEVLYLLVANEGRVLTRDEIIDHLWGSDFVSGSNVVDRHVRTLRGKLQDNWRAPRHIATVPGRGYRFLPVPNDKLSTSN